MAMHLYPSSKSYRKGESLIEVVVALGIIIFVFSGVLTVVALSINLNLSARQRNEAINLAANKLNDFYIQGDGIASQLDSGTCVVPGVPRDVDVAMGDATCSGVTPDDLAADVDKSCDYIILRNLASDEIGSSVGLMLTTDNYIKIESHVKYFVRGIGVQEYVVTKLMRKR